MKALLLTIAVFTAIITVAAEKKMVYYPNGRVQYEYEVENGLFNGRFAAYFENGRLQIKGQFQNNQKTGLWRVWDANNTLRSERMYNSNNSFTIISEWDGTGVKIKPVVSSVTPHPAHCDQKDYLFSQRYISLVDRADAVNAAFFSSDGLVQAVLAQMQADSLAGFTDHRFTTPVNKYRASCYNLSKITGFKIREDYFYCSRDQNMKSRIVGICLVISEQGLTKDLGWVYLADANLNGLYQQQLNDHGYTAVILQTTVNAPSFNLRDVAVKESDSLRLGLIESEASAIVYAMDKNITSLGSE